MKANEFSIALEKYGDPEKAAFFPRFFKSGKGEYGEGDLFFGVTVPRIRAMVKNHQKDLDINETVKLLKDPVHEIRLAAIFILVHKYQRSKNAEDKKTIVNTYLDNMDFVNNWDLVDSSAHKIVGDWLFNYKKDYHLLTELAGEDHLWKQRVSMISTLYYIQKGIFQPTLEIAEILKNHNHDLIHKAVGWMLREVGKRDFQVEYDYLLNRYKEMPRTMLRYAIEKFDEPLRKKFLKGEV